MSLPSTKVLRDPARRWSWLVAHMKGRGSSLSAIARTINISRSAVQSAKYVAYPRVEAVLAKALDVKVQELFPDRYDADGVPTARPVGRPRNSIDKTVRPTVRARNTQARKAA